MRNGLVDEDGERYGYVNGELNHASLISENSACYYINVAGMAVRNVTASRTKGYPPEGESPFGAGGRSSCTVPILIPQLYFEFCLPFLSRLRPL